MLERAPGWNKEELKERYNYLYGINLWIKLNLNHF